MREICSKMYNLIDMQIVKWWYKTGMSINFLICMEPPHLLAGCSSTNGGLLGIPLPPIFSLCLAASYWVSQIDQELIVSVLTMCKQRWVTMSNASSIQILGMLENQVNYHTRRRACTRFNITFSLVAQTTQHFAPGSDKCQCHWRSQQANLHTRNLALFSEPRAWFRCCHS